MGSYLSKSLENLCDYNKENSLKEDFSTCIVSNEDTEAREATEKTTTLEVGSSLPDMLQKKDLAGSGLILKVPFSNEDTEAREATEKTTTLEVGSSLPDMLQKKASAGSGLILKVACLKADREAQEAMKKKLKRLIINPRTMKQKKAIEVYWHQTPSSKKCLSEEERTPMTAEYVLPSCLKLKPKTEKLNAKGRVSHSMDDKKPVTKKSIKPINSRDKNTTSVSSSCWTTGQEKTEPLEDSTSSGNYSSTSDASSDSD